MANDLKGTNLLCLEKCVDELVFSSQVIRIDTEGFTSRYTLPAIANVIKKEGMTHFVAIFKVTKKYVTLGGPAKNLEEYSNGNG